MNEKRGKHCLTNEKMDFLSTLQGWNFQNEKSTNWLTISFSKVVVCVKKYTSKSLLWLLNLFCDSTFWRNNQTEKVKKKFEPLKIRWDPDVSPSLCMILLSRSQILAWKHFTYLRVGRIPELSRRRDLQCRTVIDLMNCARDARIVSSSGVFDLILALFLLSNGMSRASFRPRNLWIYCVRTYFLFFWRKTLYSCPCSAAETSNWLSFSDVYNLCSVLSSTREFIE